MQEVYKNLFIGNDSDCKNCTNKEGYSVVHACKTCHQKTLGYKGGLKQDNPNYLIYKQASNLYLNMVDMEKELLPKYTDPIIKSAISFIDENIAINKVLVHCNQGVSRSPSIVLCWLAKNNIISNKSYIDAKEDFIKLYSKYNAGNGIRLYLLNNWQKLIQEL